MRRVEISPGPAPAYEHVSPISPARMNGVPIGYACGMTAVLTHDAPGTTLVQICEIWENEHPNNTA